MFISVIEKCMKNKKEPSRGDEIEMFFEKHNFNGQFFYRQALMSMYGKPKEMPSITAKRTPMQIQRLNQIKKKLQDFLTRKNFTLREFYRLVDVNNDQEIDVNEFSQRVSTFLQTTEAVELFKSIDHDGSNSLTTDEIHLELASIEASMLME